MPLTNDRNSDHPNDHQLVPVSKAIYAYTMDILRRYSSDGYPPEDIQAMDSIRRSAFTNGAFMGSVVGTTSYLIGARRKWPIAFRMGLIVGTAFLAGEVGYSQQLRRSCVQYVQNNQTQLAEDLRRLLSLRDVPANDSILIERSLYEDIFKQKENSSPHLPNSLENAESDDNVFDELLVSRDEIDSEHIQQTEPNDDLDEKYDHAILNQRPTLEDIRERRMDKLGRRRTLRAVPENAPEENFARQSERQKPTNDSGKMNLSANRRNQWGDLIEEEEFE